MTAPTTPRAAAELDESNVSVSEAFVKVCELATAEGKQNLRVLPGCWEYQVDARWWLALNASRQAWAAYLAAAERSDATRATVEDTYAAWQHASEAATTALGGQR